MLLWCFVFSVVVGVVFYSVKCVLFFSSVVIVLGNSGLLK